MSLLEKIKNLTAHQNPNASYLELFKIMARTTLQKIDPMRQSEKLNKSKKLKNKAIKTIKPTDSQVNLSNPKETHDQLEMKNYNRLDQTTALEKLEYSEYKDALDRIRHFKEHLFSIEKQFNQTRNTKFRYTKSTDRRDVWTRGQGRCSFVNPHTGHRCNSRYQLEIDHIVPFALGGESKPENLRLLCRAHNHHVAFKVFGPEKMNQYRTS